MGPMPQIKERSMGIYTFKCLGVIDNHKTSVGKQSWPSISTSFARVKRMVWLL